VGIDETGISWQLKEKADGALASIRFTIYKFLELRGSNASRRPSPSRLMQRIVSTMNALGNTHIHQAPRIKKDCACCIMLPQVEVGCCTPRPRKDTYASVRMAPARPRVAATKIGPSVLGIRWLKKMRRSVEPSALAAEM